MAALVKGHHRDNLTVVIKFSGHLAAQETASLSRDQRSWIQGPDCFLRTSPEPSPKVLAGLQQVKARFDPVLVPPSRKSFLRILTRIGPASLAAKLYFASHETDYFRTHDVAATRDALTAVNAPKAAEEGA
ncbi:hypothetical protein ABT063_30905 [Streptomyces sp. NPDC002838]|uniref:hypothetical protein n=1 Tax=Streptomyces sp. NPDC002838 TaxID=3154436 RepID=UPI003316B577